MKKGLLLNLMMLLALAFSTAKVNAQLTPLASTGLPNIGRGEAKFADFDNDGKLDLIIVGQTGSRYDNTAGTAVIKIFKGNGDGTFTDMTATWFPSGGFPAVTGGEVGVADYNNDGYLDFFYSGMLNDGATTPTRIAKLIKNNKGSSFTDVTASAFATAPTGVYQGSVLWGDINGDGYLDLMVDGRTFTSLSYWNNSGSRVASNQLFKNNGDGTFSAAITLLGSISPISYGKIAFADLDNDGDLDLYYSGGGNLVGYLKNDGSGNFANTTSSSSSLGIPASRGTNFTMGDFNKDGKIDIFNSFLSTSSVIKAEMYFNNIIDPLVSPWPSFSPITPFTPALGLNSSTDSNIGMVSSADYDNDGDLDITIQGLNGTVPTTALYLNDGSTAPTNPTFSASPIALTGLHYGGAIWGDVNNDGKPDLLMYGYSDATATIPTTILYLNGVSTTNAGPQAPSGITATPQSLSAVALSWTMPSNADDHTPNASLTYNIFVRNAAGNYIISPIADTTSGTRQIAGSGNITTTAYTLKGLPSGTYRWGVQAIDGSFNGGAWAKGTFQIGSTLQASNIISSNITSTGMTLSWTNGDQANRAVFMKQGIDAMPMIPDSASTFAANAAFGTATSKFRNSGWYCMYNGSGSTVDVTGLSANTGYTIAVLEYNTGSTISYNLCQAQGNPYTTGTYVAPTTQATAVTIASITSSQFNVSWVNGNGTSRAVFIYQGNSGAAVPANFPIYYPNPNYASGSQIGTSGWYCVYKGTGTSVTVTGLSEKTNYNVMVCEYNGVAGAENYLTTPVTGNPTFSQTILSITTQASNILAVAGSFHLDASWTNGTGQKRVVFITQGSAGSPTVSDNQTFTANAAFGLGTPDGSGWYCVYNGTGSSVSITGLTVNTPYRLAIYEYDGVPGNEKYLTSSVPTNPYNQSTSSKSPQAITFGSLADKTYGDPPFTLSATGGASGNPVTFGSSDTTIVKITGNTVTIVGGGTCNVTANQAGDALYADASPVVQPLNVIKASQSIVFNPLTAVTYGQAPFTLSATGGGSGNPVSFASDNTNVATVSGNTITIVGGGTCNITATQAGSSFYNAATAVIQPLAVNKATQSISFAAFPAKTYLDPPFTINATASSGLALTFVSADTLTAKVSGNILTILKSGTVKITAKQSGNTNYLAAKDSAQTLTITKALQTITFNTLPTFKNTDPDYQLGATSSSGLKVAYKCSDLSVAAIQGDITNDFIHIFGFGTATITATQKGNDSYEAAIPVSQTITVTNATDVPQLAGGEIMVYPNPANDKITISLGKSLTNGKIGVFSLTGEQMALSNLDNNLTNIDVSSLKPGIYIIKIITSEGVTIKQIVKQ